MSEIRRILYIEDEPSLAQLVKRRLERLGYSVSLAADGLSGLDLLKTQSFDAFIVDYQLPILNGLEVLAKLSEFNADIPAIMVSGQDSVSVAVEAMKLNCRDYLIKDGQSYLELLPVHLEAVFQRRQLELEKQQAESEVIKVQASLSRAQALARMGNWEWYYGDRYSWWSEQQFIVFGLQQKNFPLGVSLDTFLQCVHPDDMALIEQVERDHTILEKQSYEYRIIWPDDSIRWLHERIGLERDQQGNIIRRYGTTQDITDRKKAEKQLLLAQNVFESASEAIMVTSADHKIISVNPAFTTVTGYSKYEVLGKTASFLQSGKHDDAFYYDIEQQLEKRGEWAGEVWNRHKSGELYAEWLSITSTKNEQGNREYYVSIFSDITQHKAVTASIEHKANHDALTGLPNRNLFNDRLNTAIKVAQRENTKVALLFMDLDKFKSINDSLGHLAGDQLLKEVAKRLTAVLREGDSVSRLGGDEFTIILPDLTHGFDAEIIAEKILNELAKAYQIENKRVMITSSIGIAIYPNDGTTTEMLYKNADSAMYVAKKSGRNTFSYFTRKMQKEAQKRLILINELREGIEQEQFELYYQPIVDINSTQLMCLEAVLRWNHPIKGMLEPDMFIPLAEETGLIEALGEFAEQCALNQIKKWQHYEGLPTISLNKSHYELLSETCVKTLKMKMATMGIPMESLMIEVTEKVLLSKDKRVIHSLEQYVAQGTALSLNNYGLGHASLKSLQSLPLSLIKIDRTLVEQCADDMTVNAMVDGMILMAHSLKLKVVAEGVETEQQKVILNQKQCDYLQGYLVTKPLSADVLEKQFLFN